jgi:hypothetical protein
MKMFENIEIQIFRSNFDLQNATKFRSFDNIQAGCLNTLRVMSIFEI